MLLEKPSEVNHSGLTWLKRLDVVVHTFDPSTQETEVGRPLSSRPARLPIRLCLKTKTIISESRSVSFHDLIRSTVFMGSVSQVILG